MKIDLRFYCKHCKKVFDRRFVNAGVYEDGYTCAWCGNTVLSTRKLLSSLLTDYTEYLEKKGVDLSEYE